VNNFRVIHLVRNVTSTSMPWNDLYQTHQQIDALSSGYVCSISNEFKPGLRLDEDSKKNYFSLNFISAFFVLYKLAITNNKKRNIIIHIHNMSLIPYALFIRIFGVKCVINVHNSLVNFNFVQYNLFKLGLPCFDAFIPVSFSVADEVVDAFPDIKSKVHPIRNGIHIDQLTQINDLHKQTTKNIDVIIIARFVEQKNVARVLSVLSNCNKVNKIVWYGEGIEMESAKNIVSNSSLEPIFEFRGIKPRNEVLHSIDKSIVYLSLSKWEGIGVANIEALSLPTEVILSDIPPHNELWSDDNLTLVSLEMKDSDIADIIDYKIHRYKKREKYLLERAAAIRAQYDLRKLVKEYIKVYKAC